MKLLPLLVAGLVTVALLSNTVDVYAQKGKTENVIIVTPDGVRWIEAMKGADSSLFAGDKTLKFKDQILARPAL